MVIKVKYIFVNIINKINNKTNTTLKIYIYVRNIICVLDNINYLYCCCVFTLSMET